jgi:two-component system, cell cycle response regulator DivK
MPTVLVVEDNEANREMLARRLRREGYDVILAGTGIEAVDRAKRERPDIILMDLGLPGIDGAEATRIIKNTIQLRSVPVIVLTAHALPADKQRSTAAGCDDFDTKPIEFPRLLQKIHNLLSARGRPSSGRIPTR